jgi:hypothetical protein
VKIKYSVKVQLNPHGCTDFWDSIGSGTWELVCGAVSCSQGAKNSFFGNIKFGCYMDTEDWDRYEKNNLAFLKRKRNTARGQAL